ncbi:MAG TPA: hypothetical protein VMU69_31595 [Bradyrhizobium sp.]|nr:hypothetical protein [Bradyrhizobium sp.]
MRGLHTRTFFWQWHAVYAASNLGRGKDHWQIDGVSWSKQRHTYWGEYYSMHHEVHRLERKSGNKTDWSIMVVLERWWGPERDKSVRDMSWCKLISGRPDRVLAWLRKQDARPGSSLPDTGPHDDQEFDLKNIALDHL